MTDLTRRLLARWRKVAPLYRLCREAQRRARRAEAQCRRLEAELAEVRAGVRWERYRDMKMEASCARAALDIVQGQLEESRATAESLRAQLCSLLDERYAGGEAGR